MQKTSGWAWRRSRALRSRDFTSCILMWRTGRRWSTGLSIASHWRVPPRATLFISATSPVTCLMPWPTAPAWDSPQKIEMMTTTETPTVLAVTQVKLFYKLIQQCFFSSLITRIDQIQFFYNFFMLSWPFGRWLVVQCLRREQPQWKVFVVEGKRTLYEKEGHSLEAWHRALIFPQDDQDDSTTSSDCWKLQLKPTSHTFSYNTTTFSQTLIISNAQPESSIEVESEVTQTNSYFICTIKLIASYQRLSEAGADQQITGQKSH